MRGKERKRRGRGEKTKGGCEERRENKRREQVRRET